MMDLKCNYCGTDANIEHDCIDVLKRELAALRERTRWRKWPDEKPKYGEWCLIKVGTSKYPVAAYLYEPDAIWKLWGGKLGFDLDAVSHWMPLPEPPEDDKIEFDQLLDDHESPAWDDDPGIW